MAIGGIKLSPSQDYIERHKSGKVNLSATIRRVVSDMPNEDTFTSTAMTSFLANCGVDNPGRVQSSLSALSKRERMIEKQPIQAYYRVNKE